MTLYRHRPATLLGAVVLATAGVLLVLCIGHKDDPVQNADNRPFANSVGPAQPRAGSQSEIGERDRTHPRASASVPAAGTISGPALRPEHANEMALRFETAMATSQAEFLQSKQHTQEEFCGYLPNSLVCMSLTLDVLTVGRLEVNQYVESVAARRDFSTPSALAQFVVSGDCAATYDEAVCLRLGLDAFASRSELDTAVLVRLASAIDSSATRVHGEDISKLSAFDYD